MTQIYYELRIFKTLKNYLTYANHLGYTISIERFPLLLARAHSPERGYYILVKF